MDIKRLFLEKVLKGNMRGDFPFFFYAPVIFLVLIIVTSVIFIAWQTTLPILNTTANSIPNMPASYVAIPNQLGDTLYAFNTYLVVVFFFAMLGSIISTVLLNTDLTSWIVGVILLPFVYYISAFITNIGRVALTQPILAPGVAHLKLPLEVMANMQTIIIAFAIFYVVAIAVRLYFYSPSQQNQ